MVTVTGDHNQGRTNTHARALTHTHSRTPLNKGFAHHRNLYLTTHITHNKRQTYHWRNLNL